MIKVIFLKDDVGSEDGNTIIRFKAGQAYEISHALFRQFELRETAKVVQEEMPVEIKAEPEAPQNKAVFAAPNNKKKTKKA